MRLNPFLFAALILLVSITMISGVGSQEEKQPEKVVDISHTFGKVDIRDSVNFTFDNSNFVFNLESEKGRISLRLCSTYEDADKKMVKDNLSELKEKAGLSVDSKIESDNEKFKFGWNISTGVLAKSKVNSVCLETDKPLPFDNSNWYFSDYKINFDDLKELGFDINLTNTTLTISNLSGKEFWFDPTIQFAVQQITSVAVAALDSTTAVVVWCDDTQNDITFRVFDTNGTNITQDVDITSTAGGGCDYTSVAVSALNSTVFVVGRYDSVNADITFDICDRYGTCFVGPIDADISVGVSQSVSVSALNETAFVIGWYDNAVDDAIFAIYSNTGTLMVNPTDADTTVGISLSVSALNSTDFVIGWYDNPDFDSTFAIYSGATLRFGPTDVDTDVIDARSVSVSSFNETDFVMSWYDNPNSTFAIYSQNTLRFGPFDADITAGTSSQVSVSSLNESDFVMSWYSQASNDFWVNVYNAQGVNASSATKVEDSPGVKFNSVFANATATGIGFCPDTFVIAYANGTAQGDWQSFYSNGSSWAGDCPSGAAPPTMCTPTVDVEWVIVDAQTCSSDVNIGSGNIVINTGGTLTLISGANVTAKSLQLNVNGDSVFINSGSELRVAT